MADHWLLTLKLETETAFHTLGPGETLPLIDRMLQVDPAGRPMIPGSSVRGRVRAHLERLLKATGRPVCKPPQPAQTCPHHPGLQSQLAALPEPYCLACRIFGSVWRDSTVNFTDFHLAPTVSAEAAAVTERISVSINRKLNSAQAERLFTSQTTGPGQPLTFYGEVELFLERLELGWLLAGAKMVNYLGGGKARGLGKVRLTPDSLRRWEATSRSWHLEEANAILEETLNHAAI